MDIEPSKGDSDMKIGIHKLGFNDHKYEPSNIYNVGDTNGMLTEVNLLLNAFNLNGYDAQYVDLNSKETYDITIVFNGHENYTSNLEKLKLVSKELNYVLTDSIFYDRKSDMYVDNYFVQSPIKLYKKPTFNSHLHRLPAYEKQFYAENFTKHNANNKRLIFGGSVKGRRKKVLEYIIRPLTDYYLRFEELSLNTRLPIMDYKRKLRQYTYGIVLINMKDSMMGNITWRYYEYIANGVLTFVDRQSDPRELILCDDDFMKVSSYEEMIMKQRLLANNPAFRNNILNIQKQRINMEDYTGMTFVKAFLGGREENVR